MVKKLKTVEMSKNHIWIGTFQSEKEFAAYIDQAAYHQAWYKYNHEPLQYGEEDVEPSAELRCTFCKEIGMETYDEDFLHIHFEPSGNFEALLSRLPANLKKTLAACKEKNITDGNAFICYSANEMTSEEHPEKSIGMVYLGAFVEATPKPLGIDENTRLGLEDNVWAGLISETKETFMKYFHQEEKKKPFTCAFCSDINIPCYLPENIQIFYADKPDRAKTIIEKAISNQKLATTVVSEIENEFPKNTKFNAVVHLVQHNAKNEKEEPKVRIYPKVLVGKYPTPKKYVEEKDSYNGLTFIGQFAWK
jgi:hypothetical protein